MARALWLLLFTLLYFVILELMLVAAVLYWPNFEENVEALRLMAPIPALKDIVTQIEQGGVFPYVAGQQFFKACNSLGSAAAVLFSVGAVAGEASRGTLEMWLARPFSRARILTERYALGALALCVPVFLSSATIPWLADRVDEAFELWPLMLCSFHQCCLLMAIYSLTFLLSALGSHPIRIALLVLFVTTFEFAIYMIMEWTHYSIYRLSDIEDFIAIESSRAIDWRVCGPLLAVAAAFYGASLWAFRRRVP